MAEIKAFGVTFNTDKITEQHKIIAGVVFSVLILGLGIYYLLYPKFTELQVLKEDNEKLEIENSNMERKLGFAPPNKYSKITSAEKEIKKLKSEVKIVQSRIPSKEYLATLLYDLERISENNRSDLLRIGPSGLRAVSIPSGVKGKTKTGLENTLKQMPLSLNVQTNFPDLISLFEDLERYENALSADTLTISPKKGTNRFSDLNVTFTLKAFVLLGGR